MVGFTRRCGYYESFLAEGFEALTGGYSVVGIVTLATGRSIDFLTERVAALCARHPVLGSRLAVDSDGDWWFRPADPAHVTIRRAPAGAGWQERFTDALATPLDPSLALWRVELVEAPADDPDAACAVIVSGHHAATDGVANRTLLRELTAADVDLAPLPAQPASERLEVSGNGASAALTDTSAAPNWPVAAPSDAHGRGYGFIPFRIDADIVELLHHRAHTHGVTIGEVLLAACRRSRHTLSGATDTVGYNVPIDVRPRVVPPLPDATLGSYFDRALFTHTHAGPDRDIWTLSRELAAPLRGQVDGISAPPDWNSTSVRRQVAEVCRSDRTTFDLSFAVTNLGRSDLGPDARSYHFSLVQTSGAYALVLSAATCGGHLDLGVGWPQPLTRDADATAFADSIRAELYAAAGIPPTDGQLA